MMWPAAAGRLRQPRETATCPQEGVLDRYSFFTPVKHSGCGPPRDQDDFFARLGCTLGGSPGIFG